MGYQDEVILRLMQRKKKNALKKIMSGSVISIDGNLYTFVNTVLFQDRFSMLLPSEFVDMPEDMTQQKYLYRATPQLIKTNMDGSVVFSVSSFALSNYKVTEEQLYDRLLATLRLMRSSDRIFTQETIDTGTSIVKTFDFRCSVLDGSVYNVVFTTSDNEQIFYGVLSCPYRSIEWWKPVMIQVVNSIRTVKE